MKSLKKYIKKIFYTYDFTKFIFNKIRYLFFNPKSQSNESKILNNLINKFEIKKNFLEIGFSPWEFNCSDIIDKNNGYIIDANTENIQIGNWLYKNSIFINKFIDLDNISEIIETINKRIDILSLDIDGNDYYIMEKLFKLNPSLIICEYNSAYHLRPISSLYKKKFDRIEENNEMLYFGCSLKGWEILMKKNGYYPVSISESGVNAFFVKDSLIKNKKDIIDIDNSFKDYNWPNNETHKDQWEKIKNLNFKHIN